MSFVRFWMRMRLLLRRTRVAHVFSRLAYLASAVFLILFMGGFRLKLFMSANHFLGFRRSSGIFPLILRRMLTHFLFGASSSSICGIMSAFLFPLCGFISRCICDLSCALYVLFHNMHVISPMRFPVECSGRSLLFRGIATCPMEHVFGSVHIDVPILLPTGCILLALCTPILYVPALFALVSLGTFRVFGAICLIFFLLFFIMSLRV